MILPKLPNQEGASTNGAALCILRGSHRGGWGLQSEGSGFDLHCAQALGRGQSIQPC